MTALLTLLLASSASAGGTQTKLYADPQGRYELQAPAAWTVQGNAETKAPVSLVEFVGSDQPQEGGEIIGAVLKVVRLSRKDNPKASLAPTEKLVARSPEIRIGGGRPARGFARSEKRGKYDLKTSGFVVETDDAYYIVEFRAEKKQYDKNKWALERARATFRLL